MKHIARILDDRLLLEDKPKFAIQWSDEQINRLRIVAAGVKEGRSPVDQKLAAAILLAVQGQFEEALYQTLLVARAHLALVESNPEAFISLLFAFFAIQDFRSVEALLRDKYTYARPFTIAVEENGPGEGRVRWDVAADGSHAFTFDASTYTHDNTRTDILAFQWAFPLYAAYSYEDETPPGSVVINQGDIGQTPGLAWCDNRPEYFLVPDCIFIPTKGYEHARHVYAQNAIPWENRKPVAFWRGGTTGVPARSGDWRSLERVKLCEIASEHSEIVDAGLSSVVQFSNPQTVEEIKSSNLFRGFFPWERWGEFKFQIDIDGNSSPWSNLFQRLLSGSTVLKVESSRGLNQWYYDKLKPWENYVPIASDMSDLVDKVEWLIRNDQYARQVGLAGQQLAQQLTYEGEISRSKSVVSAAFNWFSAENIKSGPFGRPILHGANSIK